MIKTMYTFYSPTHKVLYDDFFLPSFEQHIGSGVDLVSQEAKQECATGSFYEAGWTAAMLTKTNLVYDGICQNMGKIVAFVDVDCQFFGDVCSDMEQAIGDMDLVGQNDGAFLCAGVLAINCNETTKAIWEKIPDHISQLGCDQRVLNAILRHPKNRGMVRYDTFDWQKYWNIRQLFDHDHVWTGEELSVPDDTLDKMILHHANFTVGVEKKIQMMEMIRGKKNQRLQASA